MKFARIGLWGAVAVLATAFVVFVWPTAYRNDRWKSGTADTPLRINRFNGSTEMFLGRWVPAVAPTPAPQITYSTAPRVTRLTDEEIKQLEIDVTPGQYSQRVNVSVYNGSSYSLDGVVVEVTYKTPQSTELPDVLTRNHIPFIPYSSSKEMEQAKLLLKHPRKYKLSGSVYPFSATSLKTSKWDLDLGFDPGSLDMGVTIVEATGTKER